LDERDAGETRERKGGEEGIRKGDRRLVVRRRRIR
jgi:hypothetical protein